MGPVPHYEWPEAKIERLMADPDVEQMVGEALSAGLRQNRLDPEAIYRHCRQRYRRKEPAALLFYLVLRFMEEGLPARGAPPIGWEM